MTKHGSIFNVIHLTNDTKSDGRVWFQLTLACHNFRKQTEIYSYILTGLSQRKRTTKKKNAIHISGIISQSADEDSGKWKLPAFFFPLEKVNVTKMSDELTLLCLRRVSSIFLPTFVCPWPSTPLYFFVSQKG